jgi:hypothetical protein
MTTSIFKKPSNLRPSTMKTVAERRFDDAEALCATWPIQARYSPQTMVMKEASSLLDRVRVLKEQLK